MEIAPQVLIFGLSANPPTGLGGHAGMVAAARETGHFAEIWVLPVYTHMFHTKRRQLESFEHRTEMCRRNFEHLSTESCKVRVLEVERETFMALRTRASVTRVGTADVMDFLMERYPETRFSFLMGTDTYRDLLRRKWKRSDELLERLSFVVFRRASHDSGLNLQGRCQDTFIDSETLTDISSTAIRESGSLQFLREHLHHKVVDYILEHDLYRLGARKLFERRVKYVRYAAGILGISIAFTLLCRCMRHSRWAHRKEIARK